MPESTNTAPAATVICSSNSATREWVKLVEISGQEFRIRLTPDDAEALGQSLTDCARRARSNEPPKWPAGVTDGW